LYLTLEYTYIVCWPSAADEQEGRPMSPHIRRNARRPIEDLRHHVGALERHHEHLEERLRDALSALVPDAERIAWIRAEKLKVWDEIVRSSAALRRRARKPRRDRFAAMASAVAAAAD
jgi:hypothetical protein